MAQDEAGSSDEDIVDHSLLRVGTSSSSNNSSFVSQFKTLIHIRNTLWLTSSYVTSIPFRELIYAIRPPARVLMT
jgi:hypothetical protein